MSTETKHPALRYMEELRAERRQKALEVLRQIEKLHAEILQRRDGELIDVDAVLDEMRGYTD